MRIMLKDANNTSLGGYIGQEGELIVNGTNKELYVMDGITQGGKILSEVSAVYTVNPPAIVSPIATAIVSTSMMVFETTPYSGDGVHTSTLWEIATDSAFTNIVYSLSSTVDLTSHYVSEAAYPAPADTALYVRASHTSSVAGTSTVSQSVGFVTAPALSSMVISTLIADDAADYARFGASVDVSADGNTVVIGASFDTTLSGYQSGSVYIFNRIGSLWSQIAKMTANDTTADDRFGASVAISADGLVVAIGAISADVGASTDAGKVYIYNLVSGVWSETATLTPATIVSNDFFGSSVTLSATGDMLLAGSTGEDTNAIGAGLLYEFTLDAGTGLWVEGQSFSASNPLDGDYYGHGVSISSDGTRVAVASSRRDVLGVVDAGTVYVYTRDVATGLLTEIQQIEPPVPYASGAFGRRLKLDATGEYLSIGSTGDSEVNLNDGAVFIYKYDPVTAVFVFLKKVKNPNGYTGLYYGLGSTLSNAGKLMVIGDRLANTPGKYRSGKVYIYG